MRIELLEAARERTLALKIGLGDERWNEFCIDLRRGLLAAVRVHVPSEHLAVVDSGIRAALRDVGLDTDEQH